MNDFFNSINNNGEKEDISGAKIHQSEKNTNIHAPFYYKNIICFIRNLIIEKYLYRSRLRNSGYRRDIISEVKLFLANNFFLVACRFFGSK